MNKNADLNLYFIDDLHSIRVDDLKTCHSWQKQFKILSEWGKLIQPKEAIRTADQRIQGCEVASWLQHDKIDQQHFFAFDSESRLINGLAALVLTFYFGKSDSALAAVDIRSSLHALGIQKHLSPSRNNGLRALIEHIESQLV